MAMGKKRKRSQKQPQAALPKKRSRQSKDVAWAVHGHPVLSRYYPRVVTLRQYLLEELPSTSKARRRQVISLGKPKQNKKHEAAATSERSTQNDSETSVDLARFLDSTLVGIEKDVSPAVLEARRRELAAFIQSEERSLIFTGTEQQSAQCEVSY